MDINAVRKELYHVSSMRENTSKKIEDCKVLIASTEHDLRVKTLATQILETYLESVSKGVSGTLEALMRSALKVFNMDIDVHLEYRDGANGGYRTKISQNGVTGGVDSFGGGVLSLISFIMLVSTIVLKEKRRFIMLDESFSAISAEYQEGLSNFINQLCEDFGFTICLISHQPALSAFAGTSYVVSSNSKEGTVINKLTQ